jgi:hypothetical protein
MKAHYSSLGIGLGCLLYDYKPKRIADFLGLSDELSIRRIKSSNKKQLMKRFNYADVLTSKGDAIRTTLANDYDRELVRQALKAFTPRNTTHIPLAPEELLLEKLVEDLTLTDWDFKHSLLDSDCGGLDRLIIQHNSLYARHGEDLEAPELRLFVPDFKGLPTPPVDRFKAPRLTDNEVLLLNERHKSSGSRADDVDDDVDDLLSDFYECGVDGSIIELFDDSTSATNESAPLQVLSHDSYTNSSNIRILFLAAGDGAMEKNEIMPSWIDPIDDSQLMMIGTMLYEMLLDSPVSVDPDPVGKVDWHYNYNNLSWDNIDVRIACWSKPIRSVVCSTAAWNLLVPNYSPTVCDYINCCISEDLTQPWTSGYPFIDVWEWRQYITPKVPIQQDLFLWESEWGSWYWFDNRKPKPNFIESWVRLFYNNLERGNGYQELEVCHGPTVSKHAGRLPKPVHPKASKRRGYDPALRIEKQGNPFEARWLTGLKRQTDGHLGVIRFHSLEHEQLKDLRPYVPKEGSFMSDWYDPAGARRLQDSFLPRLKKTDARHREANPSSKSSFPLWGISLSANCVKPEPIAT